MRPRLTSTAAGLATVITLAVLGAFGTGAYLFSRHHFARLLEQARENSVAEAELIREALEHQMLENDRELIAEMVSSFGTRSDIESVEILDHRGEVRFASEGGAVVEDYSEESRTCQSCHGSSPADTALSRVLEPESDGVLRVVVAFPNRPACQRCHDPASSVNGLLILDTDVGPMQSAMNRDLRWMVAGSGMLAVLLMGVVAASVQLLLLRRLRRFETTARLIAAGDLERRVPTRGSDTISWLAREFNTMADSMTGMVKEIRQQRERLETVINSIGDGIVVLDRDRRIIAANRAFLRRAGRARDEVLGCACGGNANGICAEPDDCPTLACLRTGEPQVRLCERRDGSGRVIWEEVHSSPVRDGKGETAQVVEVWRDITDRRGAEARLAESHRLASLGMLASGFSHEMNTPLATILTCVEGILKEMEKGADLQPDARTRIERSAVLARDQVLRCRGITQHFLRLSRGQSSPGEAVDLGELARSVVRLVQPTARGRGVEITVAGSEEVTPVRADEAELQHALMNLVINAVEACGEGGRVEVMVKDGRSPRVAVTDDGPGVTPEEVSRIFEPFVSLRKGGTGLGLFLALNFVRRWGGDILVRSTPGEGSTFEIVLPALEAAGRAEERHS